MRIDNRKIGKDLRPYPVPEFDRDRMENTIRLVRKAYGEKLLTGRIGFLKLAAMQIRFIGRWVWIAQAAFLFLSLLFIDLYHLERHGRLSVLFLFSVVAPMIAFLGIPELLKSHIHNMEEIEACTRFSMRRLIGARMLILGIADLCCLTVIFAASAAGSGTAVARMVLYLLVPFNLTCCGCLTVLDRVKSRYAGYLCGAVCVIFIVAFGRLSLVAEFYEASAAWVWIVMFTISSVYLAVEAFRTIRGFNRFLSHQEKLSVAW